MAKEIKSEDPKSERMKALQLAMDQLEKQHGKGTIHAIG